MLGQNTPSLKLSKLNLFQECLLELPTDLVFYIILLYLSFDGGNGGPFFMQCYDFNVNFG